MTIAEISHWPSICFASWIRMPCPRDQIDFLSKRPSYGLSTDRSRAQQKVGKNRIKGDLGDLTMLYVRTLRAGAVTAFTAPPKLSRALRRQEGRTPPIPEAAVATPEELGNAKTEKTRGNWHWYGHRGNPRFSRRSNIDDHCVRHHALRRAIADFDKTDLLATTDDSSPPSPNRMHNLQ
jgi:hypothetical protein